MLRKFLLVLLAIFALGASVTAQSPDPTGRGRYTVIQNSQAYPGAIMVSQLPAGATCAPVGELAGQEVWNSTGSGTANLVQLSSSAEVAVVNGEVYLCKCGASGRFFNKLFMPEEPAPTPVRPQVQPVAAGGGQQQQQQQVIHSPQPIVVQPTVTPPAVNVAAPNVTVPVTVQPAPVQVVVTNRCDGWCKAGVIAQYGQIGATLFGNLKIASAINNIRIPAPQPPGKPPVVTTLPPGVTTNPPTAGGFRGGGGTFRRN